jgi:hypothetical protein
MNVLVVNQVGGFPMTTRILDEIQKAHAVFNALGALGGDLTIISGCAVAGLNVGNGYVYINGEVLEFRGGLAQTKVIVKEDTEFLVFQNGNSNPVIKTRYATFGTGINAINWADFKRPLETKNLAQTIAEKAPNTAVAALVARVLALENKPSNVPLGLIAIWDRPVGEIPDGWEEYVELRGKMPLGHDGDDVDFDNLGSPGGSKTKKLEIPEMPAHTHTPLNGGDFAIWANNQAESGSGSSGYEVQSTAHPSTTSSVGDGQAFSIMNPHRIVHFIKYIG